MGLLIVKQTRLNLDMPRGRRVVHRKRRTFKRVPKAVKRYVKKEMDRDIELKPYNVFSAYAQIDRSAQITCLTAPAQGIGQGQRVGDQIRLKWLEFRLDAYLVNAGGLDFTHHLRVIIFRWKLSNTVLAPALSNVLATLGTVQDDCAAYNWQGHQQKDFTILYDHSMPIHRYSGATLLRKKIHLKNSRVDFDTGLSTGEGAIYALLIADDVTGAHATYISAQWNSRVVYTDA